MVTGDLVPILRKRVESLCILRYSVKRQNVFVNSERLKYSTANGEEPLQCCQATKMIVEIGRSSDYGIYGSDTPLCVHLKIILLTWSSFQDFKQATNGSSGKGVR